MKNHILSTPIDDTDKRGASEVSWLSEMVTNFPAIVAMTSGKEHTFIVANSQYLKLIGNIDVIGKTVREVRPELENQGFFDILDQVYLTGKSFSATEKLVRIGSDSNGKGTDVYLNFVYQAHRNEVGDIAGILLFANDVTEQVLARKKAEESEKRYRQIVETAQEGIWIIDRDKRTTFVNKKLCEILEYTPEEMLGQLNTSFMDLEGREIALNAGNTRELGMTEKVDIPLITKSGRKVWATLSGSTYVDEKGEFDGGLAMVMDITEQRSAQEYLKYSEQRFRSLIENSEDLLTLIHPDATVTYISPSAERILGYSLEETKGLNAFSIIHRDDVPASQFALQQAIENPGKPVHLEFRNRRKDGVFIWFEGTLINMLDIPSVNQIVANTRDVTQRKKAEDQTKKIAAILAEAQHIAKCGNWNFDLGANKLTWSRELYNIFGIEKGEFHKTLDSFIDLVDPADRQYVLETHLNSQNSGNPFDIEFNVTVSAGERRVINEIGYAEHDLSGKVVRLYGTAQDITERKRAAEELMKEKNLSDSIINSLAGIFYLLDLNGNFLRWNTNLETVLGYNSSEILELKAIDVFKHDDREYIIGKISEVFLQGNAEAEASVITKRGDEVPFYFKASAVNFDGAACLIGMAVDVTELRKAEAVIKESEAKYRAFFEHSTDAILILDGQGKVLEANPAAALIFGIDDSIICTMNVFDLFDPGNEEIQRILKELHETGKSKGELVMLRKDGTQFPCEVSVVTYRDSLNEVRTSKIIRDITERKIAEEQLIKINERYKLATRATSNAIWDWNLITDEILWSDGYKSTFGYELPDDTENFTSFADKIYPADYNRFIDKIGKVIRGDDGTYWEDEFRFIKADGSIAYLYDRGNLIFDQDQRPVRFVGAMQDITSKKEIETERELLIKELMRSNSDLKQFSFITSHNLRSPLSNISAILDLIDYSTLDAHNLEMIELLKESGKQLETTIADLSNILIIKNNINVKVTSIDLEEIFNEIIKTFLIELENVGGRIITDFKNTELRFHKTYIESIFINLVSNAIKYRSPDRKLVLKISSYEDLNGNFVLSFSDNGIGIDLNRHHGKVFGLYQRFNSQIQGHGLGLYIIKSQITALGGNIEIESQIDIGTAFIITLPGRQQNKI